MAVELLAAGSARERLQFRRRDTPGVYRIVRALPAEGRPLQYRIKSGAESFERVVDASRIEVLALV